MAAWLERQANADLSLWGKGKAKAVRNSLKDSRGCGGPDIITLRSIYGCPMIPPRGVRDFGETALGSRGKRSDPPLPHPSARITA
jgi:hypothetical protein